MADVLYVRLSARLRAAVDESGPVSDGARALLLIGAAAAGVGDRTALERDAHQVLAGSLDPRVAQALKRAFFGPASDSATDSASAIGGDSASDSASPEAPLMTVAELDALGDDPLDVGREI